jgi:hypothetical protein
MKVKVISGEVRDADAVSIFNSLESKKQKQILKIQTKIETHLLAIKTNSYAIGKCLSEAKEVVGHGNFKKWIQETWKNELPYSTAALYLKIYNEFEKTPDLVRYLPVGFLQQVSQTSFPESILALIKEQNPDAFDKSTIDDIGSAYRDFKSGKIKLDEFNALAKDVIELGTKMLTGETQVRQATTAKRTKQAGVTDLKNVIKQLRDKVQKIDELFASAWESETEKDKLKELSQKDIIEDLDSAIQELQALKQLIIKGPYGPLFKENLAVKDGVPVMATEDELEEKKQEAA